MHEDISREQRRKRLETLKRLAEVELQFLVLLHDIGGTDIEKDSHDFASPHLYEAYATMQHASACAGRHLYSVIDARPMLIRELEDDDAAAA